MERFDEARFRQNVDAALRSIRTILDNTSPSRIAEARRIEGGTGAESGSGPRMELDIESAPDSIGESQDIESGWEGVDSVVEWERLPRWMRQPLPTGPPLPLDWLGGSEEE